MDREQVATLCNKSLKVVPIGTAAENIAATTDFYAFMFSEYPDLRKYFKGAESYTAEKVKQSERFQKQGQRIMLAVHILADTYTDPDVFHGYARETTDRHRQYKMDKALWHAFFTVFVQFLETKEKLDDDTKAAWAQLGKDFADECITHLANHNREY